MKVKDLYVKSKPVNLSNKVWQQMDIVFYSKIDGKLEAFVDGDLIYELEIKMWSDFYNRFNNNLIYKIKERIQEDLKK